MKPQKIINEEDMQRIIKEQRQLDELTRQLIKLEEEWLQRRLRLLETLTKSTKQVLEGNDNTPQTEKLTTEVCDNAVFRRLQGLDKVLESIFR